MAQEKIQGLTERLVEAKARIEKLEGAAEELVAARIQVQVQHAALETQAKELAAAQEALREAQAAPLQAHEPATPPAPTGP